MSKYDPLAAFLAEVPADQGEVHLSFAEVDRLVGGLPGSAREHRPWWGNSSSVQGSAWTRAGWHVGVVDLQVSEVWFVRRPPRAERPGRGLGALLDSSVPGPRVSDDATGPVETVTVGVTFSWHRLGRVTLHDQGHLVFPGPPPETPGLYRFTVLHDATPVDLHIGESENLRARLAAGEAGALGQPSDAWLDDDHLVACLADGLDVVIDIATQASLEARGEAVGTLDLGRTSARLLVENAARVLTQRGGSPELVGVG